MNKTLTLAAAFIGTILAANYVTTEYGMIPVGFGLMATAGTYFAGLAFVLRDSLQDAAGKSLVFFVIVGGAGLSYLVSDPFIALASGVAFLLSETADLAVYTPLRKRGYVKAAVASNVVGTLVDTYVFLKIAGFPLADAFAGQVVGKLTVTLIVVLAIAAYRTRRLMTATVAAKPSRHKGSVVYLAGPINGCTDAQANDWRTYIKQNHTGPTLDPMRRDYRGREDESVNEIVELDKVDVQDCDVFLANCPQPSYGTAMEIFYAWEIGKPVIVVHPADKPVSPWIRYHSTAVVHSLDEALEAVAA